MADAKPVTIKRKTLTIKTVRAAPVPEPETDESAEVPALEAAELAESSAVKAAPAKPARKGIPFLISTICAGVTVVLFIVVIVVETKLNGELGAICPETPHMSSGRKAPTKEAAPAKESAPAKEVAKEKPAATAPAAAAAPAAPTATVEPPATTSTPPAVPETK